MTGGHAPREATAQDEPVPAVFEPARYPVEPWCLRETALDLDHLAQAESVFALSNGHIGLRGNLDEGEPSGVPGTYLNSFYEERPLPYAEAGFGYPEEGQTLVNVTNGKVIRLLVEDEPFDLRYGDVHAHERVLDLRAGTLTRRTDWTSPGGKRVVVRSTRLVSFAHRSIAAICYEVEAVERTRIIVQSELVANEELPPQSKDPRVAAALTDVLEPLSQDIEQHGVMLVHRTRASGLTMAAGMDHVVDVPGRHAEETDARPNWARTTVTCILKPGEVLRVVKFLSYGWSSQRSKEAVRDQAAAALVGARYEGWEGVLAGQRAYLDAFWADADVEVEGDEVLQQAVRFALFHVLQSGARAERRAVSAKGLTGPGYDGHAFWDTEGFVLPLLTYTLPGAAADALRWRHSILDMARQRAQTLGLRGAAFPWRTIRGQECSAYWPAGTAAFHINADIARAFERYRMVTGDDGLERECGLEVLVETARLWCSLGHHDRSGAWHVDGVTGPDEYSAVADDNVFTNLMAAANLRSAAAACARHPEIAAALGVAQDEPGDWVRHADAVHVPYDEELGVHPQSEGFTRYDTWDFEASRDRYPLMMYAPYVQLYRKQVLKQVDVVLAMQWFPDAFTPEQKARNVDYYERITVRDSSLSACTQSVMCAEVGHLELAHDYAHEAALVDLRDLHHNTKDGLHLASLAGAWSAVVEGFGGLREHEEILGVDPQLPDGITRICFRLLRQGMRLRFDVDRTAPGRGQVSCTLEDGPEGSLRLLLCGEEVTVRTGEPVERSWTARTPLLPRPTQPPGRAPASHDAG